MIFEKNDLVYDFNFGWGIIMYIFEARLPLSVKFKHFTKAYTEDGRYGPNVRPTLSFTEYTLENGGFSQNKKYAEKIN